MYKVLISEKVTDYFSDNAATNGIYFNFNTDEEAFAIAKLALGQGMDVAIMKVGE